MSFDNEGWAIFLIVFFKVRGCKNSRSGWCGYKNIQLICPICQGTYKDKKRNSIDKLSKLLTCVLLYFARSRSWWVFVIQDLHLNFHSFLGFQHESGLSVKAIMPLSATLPLTLVIFLISINIIVISKVSHTWIIFPRS